MDEKTLIPAHSIKLYDPDGNKTGRLLYSDHTVTLECTSSDPLGTSEPEASATITSEAPGCEADAPSTMKDEDSETSTVDVPPMEQEDNEVSTAAEEPSIEQEDSDNSNADTAPLMTEMSSSIQNGSSCINPNPEEHQEGLKTSVGNSIKRLLGSDDDLVKFDDLHLKLKEAKKTGNHLHMKTSVSEYQNLASKFTAKIRLVQSERAAELKELELHFQQNGTLPAKTRGSHYYNILKERNVAITIL